jgi:hypothetical protein
VVRPQGQLIDLFTLFQGSGNNQPGSSLAMMRSTDHGATWSQPQVVHMIRFDGAFDPDTGLPIRAEDHARLGPRCCFCLKGAVLPR